MFDVREELARIPESPAEVLGIAKRFIDSWFGGVSSNDGYGRDELRLCEERIGSPIPVALRDFYALLGRRSDLLANQDPVCTPSDLSIDPSGVMVIREENQSCALWGVGVDSESRVDPPVYIQTPVGGDAKWVMYHERLSVALLEFLLEESMLSGAANTIHAEASPVTLSKLSESFEPLGIPRHAFWPVPDHDVTWYGDADTLLRNDGNAWVWATSAEWSNLDFLGQWVPAGWTAL